MGLKVSTFSGLPGRPPWEWAGHEFLRHSPWQGLRVPPGQRKPAAHSGPHDARQWLYLMGWELKEDWAMAGGGELKPFYSVLRAFK